MYDDQIYTLLNDTLQLRPHPSGEGWSILCPRHEDRSPSAKCYRDGWMECYAGCGRFHINQVCKERGLPYVMPTKYASQTHREAPEAPSKPKEQERIVRGDFTALWLDLEPLPNDIEVKGVPAMELNKRGWRKFDGGNGLRPGIFIPYFDTTKKFVPFFQIRHLEGDRRFSFAPGITPICYGMEQLPKCQKYLCFTEGSRDSVILGMAGVPAVALPSASSKIALAGMMKYCTEHNLIPVAICDRDEAGEKLLQSIEGVALDARTPVGKDVGDFYEKEGLEAVKSYYSKFAVLE